MGPIDMCGLSSAKKGKGSKQITSVEEVSKKELAKSGDDSEEEDTLGVRLKKAMVQSAMIKQRFLPLCLIFCQEPCIVCSF